MITSLILVQGEHLTEEDLMISLQNAKQLVQGNTSDFGMIVHLAASTHTDYQNALLDFSKVEGVSQVMTVAININN